MKKFFVAIAVTLSLSAAGTASAQILLEDGFESADMSATNEQGFAWDKNNRTSVITKDTAVWNNKQVHNEVTHDNWDIKEGTYALRFRYPAGIEWAEQRFELGTPEPEVWFRFWLRVPHNYAHKGTNRKLFALWMDGYSAHGEGPSIAWEFWPKGSDTSELAFHYSSGGNRAMGGHTQHQPFITYPQDRRRWMQLVFHIKAASAQGSNDGIIRTWQRWEGESSYRQLHELTSADIAAPKSGPNGWAHGYIMGWANGAYPQTTEWILDGFTVSRTSLLDDGDGSSPPNPPVLSVEQ